MINPSLKFIKKIFLHEKRTGDPVSAPNSLTWLDFGAIVWLSRGARR